MRNPLARRPRTELLRGDEYCLHPAAMQAGHKVELLIDGSQAYPAMLEAIGEATRDVHFEMYIWNSDATGERFARALAEKAREGVTVRVIVDSIGSFTLSEPIRRIMTDAGVRLADFHPVAPWRRRWGLTVRDHRKLLLIDGRVAFTGGINIGDEYASREEGGGGWHDVHARVEGPAVRDLQKAFLESWRHAMGEERPQPPVPMGTPAALGEGRLQVMTLGRRRDRLLIRRSYSYAMKRAVERIRIQAAYFVPERGLRRVLRNAARRGVDVRLMLPRVSDIPAVFYAGRASYTALLHAGVRIFEWVPSVLHAKTVSVDGTWCALGSYNLDRRSLLYNWELALAIVDPALVAQLDAAFERDMASCHEVTLEVWSQRSVWDRFLERLFYAFRRWL